MNSTKNDCISEIAVLVLQRTTLNTVTFVWPFDRINRGVQSPCILASPTALTEEQIFLTGLSVKLDQPLTGISVDHCTS